MMAPRLTTLVCAALLAAPASAQVPARPTVAIQIKTGPASVDSSAAYAAVRRGLEADALVDVVAKSASGPAAAKYVMTVGVMAKGNDELSADIRVMAVSNATIVHRVSVFASKAAMSDSLVAVARRSARTLVAR